MNILNNQIGSIYDRQKNLYSKYLRYSQQNAEGKKVCGQEKITATSGKDVLGITKGDKENSCIVHFSDSAMVSRVVARGYVTVNGADVDFLNAQEGYRGTSYESVFLLSASEVGLSNNYSTAKLWGTSDKKFLKLLKKTNGN